MREQLEGSAAVAATVARCRPQVIAAYPISPQTHIVEGLAALVRTGDLTGCEYLTVDSEFSALSACLGASVVGARAYTATASQGLLYMAEVLGNVSGLGVPVVMTVANRAIGAPINIWNDHSDAMSQRDAGWIMLFARSNQEAVDLHVQAFAVAERTSLPVMVCMDGFVLTHATEEIDVPEQAEVDGFLPAFDPVQRLDPENPITIGSMVGPEAFTEVKVLAELARSRALGVVAEVAHEFEEAFGRESGGLVHGYRTAGADLVVVMLGSVFGTLQDVVDEFRTQGVDVGAVAVTCFRPWPTQALVTALRQARTVVVLDRAVALGSGPILGSEVRLACGSERTVHSVVAGLGGRPVTTAALRGLITAVLADELDVEHPHYLDLDRELVARELAKVDR